MPQEAAIPLPMLSALLSPRVAATLTMPAPIEMPPQVLSLQPLPMPAAFSPPVASTVPPEIVTLLQVLWP